VPNRPELLLVRDEIVRYFHNRASIDTVRDTVLDASRSMQSDGLPIEEILVVLKGAVTLAAEHVTHPSVPESAVALRAQMTPWLISLYMNESGEFDAPTED
jgi:hypothetical protein